MVVDKEVEKDKGKDKDKEVDKNVAKQLDFTILISVLIFLIRIVTAESGLRGVGRAFVMSWLDDWTFLYKAQPNYTFVDSQLFLLDWFFSSKSGVKILFVMWSIRLVP